MMMGHASIPVVRMLWHAITTQLLDATMVLVQQPVVPMLLRVITTLMQRATMVVVHFLDVMTSLHVTMMQRQVVWQKECVSILIFLSTARATV
jgi:hypothetical protein